MRAASPSSTSRLARVAVQGALVLIAAFTAREVGSILLTSPIAACGLVAAWRNDNSEVDAIDLYWLLSTLFFAVRPAQTLFENSATLYVGRAPFTYDTDVILLTFAALYIFTITMIVLLPRSGRAVQTIETMPGTGQLVLAACTGFALTLALSGDLTNLLAPRYDKEQISPLVAVGQGMLIAASAMMTATFAGRRERRGWDALGLLCCLALLAVAFNPLNTSRFGLIGAWLPIVLIAAPVVRKPLIFAAATLFSLIVLMPILSVTTRFGWDLERLLNSRERGAIGEIPYIDTFDTLLYGVHFAHQAGMQFGAKILSILLCFVPRGLWPDKPMVSGLEIGNELFSRGLTGTPNLSMPVVGDFYMDFGLAGVVAGSVAVALGLRALLRVQPVVGGYPVYGYLLLAALPIMVRGAVGAVILLPACTIVACVVLAGLSRRPVRVVQRGASA